MLRSSSLIFLALLAACSASTYPASSSATNATVNATPSITFNPSPVHVAAGTSVTFAFGSVGHNVFFDATPGAPADIDGTNANTSVMRTFSTPGTYVYNCHIHPGMTGTVIVSSAATPSDTSNTGTGNYNLIGY